jgi:hypothetical protein
MTMNHLLLFTHLHPCHFPPPPTCTSTQRWRPSLKNLWIWYVLPATSTSMGDSCAVVCSSFYCIFAFLLLHIETRQDGDGPSCTSACACAHAHTHPPCHGIVLSPIVTAHHDKESQTMDTSSVDSTNDYPKTLSDLSLVHQSRWTWLRRFFL